MTNPSDLELIDHFLGRSAAAARQRIDAQLEASPELRQRQAELTAMWDLLGKAEADLPEKDLWPGVAEGLQYESGGQKVLAGPWRLPYWARAAAAIVLATCVGYGSARARLGWSTQPVAAPAETEVAEGLGVDALDTQSYQTLACSFLGDPTITEQ